MAKKRASSNKPKPAPVPEGITRITVAGFKSISDEQSIEIAPLTILAGANSSGKSSIMQPLLLLKQTLEASYDPGALLLDGPNVKFTLAQQMFCHLGRSNSFDTFHVGIEVMGFTITLYFTKKVNKSFEIQKMVHKMSDGTVSTFRTDMTNTQLVSLFRSIIGDEDEDLLFLEKLPYVWTVRRNRCFLDLALKLGKGASNSLIVHTPKTTVYGFVEQPIRQLIHLPGLRGNPARNYPVTAVGSTFSGTFENYAASVISQWQTTGDKVKLNALSQDMKRLGLTWKVTAEPINDTQVELRVGRMPQAIKGGARDLVSIADVGFGVSQTLPVLVALLAAKPHQLVYLEQPEIHLHPRAQTAMAEVLADAANRGVHVVVETHSSLLLLGVQTLVAQGKLAPDKVKLHWFKRRAGDGATEITTADLDESGAFGDWPEDFDDVTLEAQSNYLDAVEAPARTKRRAG